MKSAETDPCKYSQLIFDKGENVIQRSKDSPSTNGVRTRHPHWRKKNLSTKINSRCTIDPSVKCKIIKLLKNNVVENLDDLEYGDDFLDTRPRHNPWKK